MPPMGRQDDSDTALRNAHTAFRSAARQRLKRLQAAGVEDAAASSTLLDDLIDHHGSEQPGQSQPTLSSSSPSVQHVIACTGASVAHASQILLLKDEIGRLRREGHSTVTLIEQLKERLRSSGEPRASCWDENDEEQSARRSSSAAGATSKKRRVGEEGAPPAMPSLIEAPPRLSPLSEYGGCGYLGEMGGTRACPPCPADAKRQRDESAPLAQLKKLKLRPPAES